MRLDLALLAGGLQRVGGGRHVHHLGPEDVRRCAGSPRGAGRLGVDPEQEHLALHVVLLGEVGHLDDVDQLVELLDHLLDDELVARAPPGSCATRVGSSVSPTDRLSML